MPLLGAHMSIAGGYYKAVEAAAEFGMDCVQIFTKNNNQWRAKPISDDEAERFKSAMSEYELTDSLSHASYLINLASPKPDLRKKSIEALVVEVQRADFLGIPYVVFHPGAFTTSSEQEGLDRIIDSLNQVHRQTEGLTSHPLLENTAGQGSNLGWQFEHLATLIEGVEQPDRLGVCIDTCHAFAAGYPLADPQDYEKTIQAMESTFGLEQIRAFHLNDSKREFGSRKDRHEHIGEGEMGLEPFRNLLNDSRFAEVPMYLETEKGERDGEDYDAMNLRVLRGLID